MITDKDLAWLAGFIDGEGSLTLWVQQMRPRPQVHAAFVVSNTDESNIQRVKGLVSELVGRQIRYRPLPPQRPGWLIQYELRLGRAEEIRALIVAIEPLFVGKRPQAVVMLRFLDTILPIGSHPADGDKFTAVRMDMVREMSWLKRGRFGWTSQQEAERSAPSTGEVTVQSSE